MPHYKIIGRAGAGSLIAEFLLSEAGQDYEISFVTRAEASTAEFHALNPLGKIPVLIRPDGTAICETLAITVHLTEAFPNLAPALGTSDRDRYWQYLAMLATCIYPAYHRQHHSYQYGPENAFPQIKSMAKEVNDKLYDYIEAILNPYICGVDLTAADLYLYMLSRWNLDKAGMREGRPKLAAHIDTLRAHPTIDATLASQPKRD